MTLSAAPPLAETDHVTLRLLQTTDLHMNLIPYDYDDLRPAPDRSLAHLRPHIAALRAEVPAVLCDTGDFLQGNAMADSAMDAGGPHPMIAAFNDLGYDAVVLGNHDFDYGLAPLRAVLGDLDCPVLAANIAVTEGDAIAAPFTVVPVETEAGVVRVGLLGLTVRPSPRVALPGRVAEVTALPAVDVARTLVPQVRAAGADVIAALCHFGIAADGSDENVAAEIAQIAGVDAVLAGHTHDVFPGDDVPAHAGIDPVAGTLHGTPAVMAGAFGRGVGVIDLSLERDSAGWQVARAESRYVQPDKTPVPPPLSRPGVLALHEATLARLRAPVAETPVEVTNVFSMIAPSLCQQMLAQARRAQVAPLLEGTEAGDLPLLASAAPHRAGNKDAPDGFLTVAPGPITLRDLIAIYPFQDPTVALHQTGAQIKDWLERAARRFATVSVGDTRQELLDARVPPYQFNTLYGVTYLIDPSRPVGARICDLSHEGRAVAPTDRFIVATSPSRRSIDGDDILQVSEESTREGLRAYLERLAGAVPERVVPWRLAELPGTAAQFVTHADAMPGQTACNVTPDWPAGPGLQRFTYRFR